MPASGTTVRLVFPIAMETGRAQERSAVAGRLPPLRILIVDDDPLVIESLRATLESNGHTVHAADGGQAGIDKFIAAQKRGEPFSVVITDLGDALC